MPDADPQSPPPRDGLTDHDVTVLLSGEIGANEILQRERIRRGWTQDDLANRCGVTRVAVTRWESGDRWPKGTTLDKLIVTLSPQSTIVNDKRLEARVTSQELTQLLHELECAGRDELDRADALITYAYPKVLSTLILKATGAPGVNADARCIDLFFAHKREVRQEKLLRGDGKARNVTPTQAQAVDGDIYEAPSGRRKTPQDVVSEADSGELSQDVTAHNVTNGGSASE